ncbi:glutathione S-transferase family protein [Variovorax soli]|uniref:Glutathione S-transferase n=1 Tax=Variovorax soli TaxID=376815 RepID=A0ABU1NNV2_9BURK|nr:glutathione S-transferase family protein [Variovorax soli]MDR6539681.1 glutathione S-transferase [Variovorax soli]
MKLYYHPASTASRPVLLFAAESGIDLDLKLVDIFKGEHLQPAYRALNPNALVPMLEDDDFRLTESSAILKYLADKFDSPLYPKGLQQRARVNERMDWFNTQLSRDYCFGLVFAQLLPQHKRRSDEAQAGTVQWGQERSKVWLQVLNDHILGPGHNYVCGDAISIADHFGAGLLTLGEVIGCEFAAYPYVQGWLARIKALKSWKSVNATLDGVTAAHKGESFVTV